MNEEEFKNTVAYQRQKGIIKAARFYLAVFAMRLMPRKLVCRIKGHTWMTWSHPGDGIYPRHTFMMGKALLKNPICGRCNELKLKTKQEEWKYRQQMKKEVKAMGLTW